MDRIKLPVFDDNIVIESGNLPNFGHFDTFARSCKQPIDSPVRTKRNHSSPEDYWEGHYRITTRKGVPIFQLTEVSVKVYTCSMRDLLARHSNQGDGLPKLSLEEILKKYPHFTEITEEDDVQRTFTCSNIYYNRQKNWPAPVRFEHVLL